MLACSPRYLSPQASIPKLVTGGPESLNTAPKQDPFAGFKRSALKYHWVSQLPKEEARPYNHGHILHRRPPQNCACPRHLTKQIIVCRWLNVSNELPSPDRILIGKKAAEVDSTIPLHVQKRRRDLLTVEHLAEARVYEVGGQFMDMHFLTVFKSY